MTEPTVCAICLTRDRPELAKRAVECFRKQTYGNKLLVVYDTGGALPEYAKESDDNIQMVLRNGNRNLTIGALRNQANSFAAGADIIVHFDDDDWSHPNRIAEQVALLQASGADVVGYNEMLFWREPRTEFQVQGMDAAGIHIGKRGEAWLYTSTRGGVPALGTSLCYWRKTWERHHFANETQGVEDHWMREKNVVGVSAMGCWSCQMGRDNVLPRCPVCALGYDPSRATPVHSPRMIARIHGGNTSNGYDLEKHVANGSREWKRVPEWDQRVRGILA